ncbi:hypothetical protein [Actinospongicola halichondriae]|uniref:hypothetical protein n=1 Tax=Actinospongicola halichondriae TaxID=3236844 RepID=UPI003D532F01
MELIRIMLAGRPLQMQTSPGDAAFEGGLLGVAVSPKTIDGTEHSVVQAMFDDDRPGFDQTLLDCPMVAEIRTPAGDVVTRELFDHDVFRQALHAERAVGGDDLRGVLLLTGGALPPAYLRLAFLTLPVADATDCALVISRFDRDELVAAIDGGQADGSLSATDHRSLSTMIDQRHPA